HLACTDGGLVSASRTLEGSMCEGGFRAIARPRVDDGRSYPLPAYRIGQSATHGWQWNEHHRDQPPIRPSTSSCRYSMIVPIWFSVGAFLVVAIAGGLACLLLVRRQNRSSHRGLAVLLAATALTHLANGLGLLDEAHALLWRRMALATELTQPAALLYVGLAFLNPAERDEHSSPLWRAR